jgi:L-ascorbate metabolism protein UlaG (beta-lactamase superfamily)
MKVKWLAQATFLLSSNTGIKIITDPYKCEGPLTYGEIKDAADIVTVSHDHWDHNNVAGVRGNPVVIRGSAEIKGINFKAIPTFHDNSSGQARGKNNVICFELDRIKVCHLGDLGHVLTKDQIIEMGEVDLLLTPVGGFFTIDARQATQICDQLKPRVVIPMHFKTEKNEQPITGVDEFLRGKKNVTRLDTSEVEFKAEKLPAATQIIVLNPVL